MFRKMASIVPLMAGTHGQSERAFWTAEKTPQVMFPGNPGIRLLLQCMGCAPLMNDRTAFFIVTRGAEYEGLSHGG